MICVLAFVLVSLSPSGGFACCLRQFRHFCKRSHVVCWHDDQIGQPFLKRDNTQQVFAISLEIRIAPSACDPWALLALSDPFQLPHNVTHERIAFSVWQRHKCDHATRSVTEGWYDYDRTV